MPVFLMFGLSFGLPLALVELAPARWSNPALNRFAGYQWLKVTADIALHALVWSCLMTGFSFCLSRINQSNTYV
ncbi:hypothetical protein [uncultured Roseibium sp.]|uniref:hypothetical protein n=1 Tax=uncultured Roseibium sp. TaxID=1936171 RepID=UPI002613CEA1|nr:hypothetical protein [uncultured Roseibium sp.]